MVEKEIKTAKKRSSILRAGAPKNKCTKRTLVLYIIRKQKSENKNRTQTRSFLLDKHSSCEYSMRLIECFFKHAIVREVDIYRRYNNGFKKQ